MGAAVFLLPWAAASAASPSPRPFTARDLVMLDRLSDPHVSPDGTDVLYSLRSTDYNANRGRTALWLMRLGDPAGAHALSMSRGDANEGRWSADGKAIYFLSSRSGSTQLWRTDTAGTRATQVTNLPLDVQDYRIAPDGAHAVVALAVFPDCTTLACTQKRLTTHGPHATGIVYDKLFIRHWDTWADGTRNHLFAIALNNGVATNAVSLMRDFDGDSPSKPFGGDEDFAISPDSRTVIYSARLAGHSEPWSTNFDLWQVPMNGSSAPKDLTAANPAWDAAPVFSPDGTRLAYKAQRRPGFESDRFGVVVRDLRTGKSSEIDKDWDRSADALAWTKDGSSLLVTADDVLDHRLFKMNPQTGAVTPISADGAVESFDDGSNGIVFARSALDSPAQLFRIAENGGAATQLTHVDAAKLAGIALSSSQRFTFTGWNGDTVHGIVTKPYGYQAGKKYPVAFLIHGGPQGSFNDDWSYRWNPQTYAGRGYAVVTVDFHGSTGYGQAFTDAISKHWGDRPLEDLQKGWASALAQFPFLNGDRACALGASYGGFMIDWIAGNWNSPWKCLVSHDGVFDNYMMGYATEELWFSEWENGGTPATDPANYERFNPAEHVADWRVPMLIVHSQHDYRIPVEQGIGAFTALQRKGIPSELLTFPDENHWVLKPQNSVEWHDTVEAWLARYLK